ncbi:TPA: phage holin [Staphylococcus aureus]
MDAKVITRYIVLILALVNQFLANKGISPIPVDEESVSSIILTVVALYTTYKDNPTSQEGKWANQKLIKQTTFQTMLANHQCITLQLRNYDLI